MGALVQVGRKCEGCVGAPVQVGRRCVSTLTVEAARVGETDQVWSVTGDVGKCMISDVGICARSDVGMKTGEESAKD